MRLFSRYEKSVLVICTANICRSPMAEGMLRAELGRRGLGARMKVESAGTRVGQPGSRPDMRAQQVCEEVGVDIHRCRARQVVAADFEAFDYLLALDGDNHDWLLESVGETHRHKVLRLGDIPGAADIPDPYYGNLAGFERVRDELHQAMGVVVEQLLGEAGGR